MWKWNICFCGDVCLDSLCIDAQPLRISLSSHPMCNGGRPALVLCARWNSTVIWLPAFITLYSIHGTMCTDLALIPRGHLSAQWSVTMDWIRENHQQRKLCHSQVLLLCLCKQTVASAIGVFLRVVQRERRLLLEGKSSHVIKYCINSTPAATAVYLNNMGCIF